MLKGYLFILLAILPITVTGQVNPPANPVQRSPDFQIATSLYQQQRYEEAAEIYIDLLEKNPTTYAFLELYANCLIQLKQYDQAISRLEQYNVIVPNAERPHIKLGELYHLKGDTAKAYKAWDDNLQKHYHNLQLYSLTARTMVRRQEFDRAVNVYKRGRELLNNKDIFFKEIADIYMQAGNFESAIREYLAAIKTSPQYINFIQQDLFRYRDPILFDIAIIEFEESLNELTVAHPAYSSLHEVLIWMLQENKLYRRALSAATRYEESTSDVTYSLYNLARNLRQNKEFELSAQAYSYYVENGSRDLRWRSTEELANVHVLWAKYLEDFGLGFGEQKDSLYNRAIELYTSIENDAVQYNRMDRVYLSLAELALDYLFDAEKASDYTSKLKQVAATSREAEIEYLEGRIALFNDEFQVARLHLTKGNKLARTELTEKTRYYLALTDFYAGDFEFAQIQLKALGRNNASFYANDALKLRLWIQKGIDRNEEYVAIFAQAVQQLNKGKFEQAFDSLTVIANRVELGYSDDAVILLSEHISPDQINSLYHSYDNVIAANAGSPLKERLLWEQAKLSEYLLEQSSADGYSMNVTSERNGQERTSTVIPTILYETLILEYPQGFYARFARERLSKLPKKPS